MPKTSKEKIKGIELTEIEKFKLLIEGKHNFKFTKIDNNYFLPKFSAFVMLEIDWLPNKYFKTEKTFDNTVFCELNEVMTFVKYSVEDNDMGDFFKLQQGKAKFQRILWRNPDYVIDYHKPMNWNIKYSFQTEVLVEIIANTLDKFQIRQTSKERMGFSEFDLNNGYGLEIDYRCDYFINTSIPIIIEVNEDHHVKQRGTWEIDERKQTLRNLNMEIFHIYEESWYKHKFIIFNQINEHLGIFYAFHDSIIKQSEDINELIEDMSAGMSDLCLHNDPFPYSLNECLKIFGIAVKSAKYKTVMSLFQNTDYNNVDSSDDSSDDESVSMSDDVSDSDNGATNEDSNNNSLIVNVDYAERNKVYYVDLPTLIQIGNIAGNKRAKDFIRKSCDLVKYVTAYGKSSYENVIKKTTMPIEKRRLMIQTIAELCKYEMLKNDTSKGENVQLRHEHMLLEREINRLGGNVPNLGKKIMDRKNILTK